MKEDDEEEVNRRKRQNSNSCSDYFINYLEENSKQMKIRNPLLKSNVSSNEPNPHRSNLEIFGFMNEQQSDP